MKSFLLGAALVGGLACSACADVAQVRREVARVDALKLSTQSSDRTDLSAEGAQILVGRDSKGAPRKIVAKIYGESGRLSDTIYLHAGVPIFRFSVEERYDGPLVPSVKVKRRIETRLYFNNGMLIQKRIGKKIVNLTRTQKQKIQLETTQQMNDYLREDESGS